MSSSSGSDEIEFLGSVSMESVTPRSTEVNSPDQAGDVSFTSPTSMDSTPRRGGRPASAGFIGKKKNPKRYEGRMSGSESDRSRSRDGGGSAQRTPQTPQSAGSLRDGERELLETPGRLTRSRLNRDDTLPGSLQQAWNAVYKGKTQSQRPPRAPGRSDAERMRLMRDRKDMRKLIEKECGQLEQLFGSVMDALEDGHGLVKNFFMRKLDGGRQIKRDLKQFVGQLKALLVDGDDLASQQEDRLAAIHQEAMKYVIDLLKTVLKEGVVWDLEKGGDKALTSLALPLFEELLRDPQQLRFNTILDLFYRAVDSRSFMVELLDICLEEFRRLKSNLNRQCYKKIIGYSKRSVAENALRTLGRMNYHVRQAGDSLKSTYEDGSRIFRPMPELWPTLRVEYLNMLQGVERVELGESQREKYGNAGGWEDEEEAGQEADEEPAVPEGRQGLFTYYQPTAEQMDVEAEDVLTDESEEDEDEAPTEEEEDDQEPEENPQIPPDAERLMRGAIAEDLGDDQMDAVADDTARDMLLRMTYICRCTNFCGKPDLRAAMSVLEKLRSLHFYKSVDEKLEKFLDGLETVEDIEDGDQQWTVAEWIGHYKRCYAGLRSIAMRLTDIRTMVRFILRIRSLLEGDLTGRKKTGKDGLTFYETYISVSRLDQLPRRVKLEFSYKHSGRVDDTHHRQKRFGDRFAVYFKDFIDGTNDYEINVCQVCNLLNVAKEMKLVEVDTSISPPPSWLEPYMDRSLNRRPAYGSKEELLRRNNLKRKFDAEWELTSDEENCQEEEEQEETQPVFSYGVCRTCWRAIKKGTVPKLAVVNGLRMPTIPTCMKELNWIEKMLIQLLRPLASICCLRDIGGKKTAIRATKGCQVIVPVDIEATLGRVAETLPSADNLMIEVRTSFGDHRVVNLPKVLKCLHHLKQFHHCYANVEIDEHFHFTAGNNVFFEKTAVTEMDAEKLIERRAGHDNDAHILTQDHFNVKPVQDVHPPQLDAPVPEDDDANIGKYMVRGHKVNPVSVDEPYADIMVFPDQHPTGEFGFSHPRAVRIHMTEYIKARIRNADRRFAKDKNWIIFCYQHLLQKQLTSTLGIQARIGQQTSGADIAARIDMMDMEFLKANMTSIFAKFRGFPPYWHQVKLKLRSHLIAFGPPSFFLTLNPNDQHWLEVIHLYKMRQPEKRIADMVNSRTIRKFIAEDPAIFARYFYRRVRTFFSKFLRAGTGDSKAPLGDITHWFWRHEWQERGTPHVHCLLWTADRPAEDASEEAVVAWINKYITCRLPDKKTEFEMNHLVTSYQMHWKKHNKTCMRKKQYGTHWKTYCRFDMPRPVLGRTVLTENNADIKALLGVRKRPYYLRRTAEETMINDYNPAVTKAWKANTDIQAILPGRAEDNLLGYCTGFSNYAAKGSSRDAFGKPQDDEDDDDLDKLWADLEEEENRADGEKKGLDDSGLVPDMPQVPGMASQLIVGGRKDQNLKAMWKKCLKLMNTRVAGMFEIMDQLMGHKLYEFDCDTVWVNVAKSEKRSRMLIPSKKRLEKSTRAFLTNMMDDYYPHRPDALEDCSLFNFVSNFEVVMPERGSGRGKPTQGGGGDGGSDPEDSSDDDPISDDDAIDDDADERLKKKRNNRRRRITADNAQTRNVFKGEYHTDVADSPFFNHPNIDIGDGYNMEFTIGNQTVKKYIRKKKARNIRFNLAAVNYDDEESVEEFYRGICTAFIPWRNEESILEDCKADNFLELFHSYTDPVNGKYSSAAIDDINAFLRRAVALKEDDKLRSDVHRRALEALRKARDPAVMEEEAFDGEGGAIRPTAGGDEPLLVRLEKIDEDGEQVERYPRIVDELQHADMVEKMKKSPKQFCIFAEIIKHIQKQVEQEKAKQPVDEPLRFFISGTAGTGKSFLIKCLADYLSINYVNSERDREDGLSPAVLIAAPTGNAAHGIGGVTIHKLIGAKIFEDMIKEGTLLSNERQQKKRALFAGVKLLIIDEISMCGSMLFYQLNLYLQAIRGDQQLFGGLNVIVLGDLLQLPPVKDLPVFKVPRQRDLEKLLGGRTVGLFRQRFNLWNQFEYRELLENHRQGADRQWGDILYRMRHGANMDEDHSVIAEHLIKSPSGHAYATRNEVLDEFFKVRDQDREVLAIFPTVDEATTFNDCVVEELNLEGTEELICDDVYFQSTHWYLKAVAKELTDPEKPKKERPYQMKGMEIDISGHDRDAANIRYKNKVPKSHRGGTDGAGSLPTIVEGLVDVLHLAPGTRVMLRRNIDTSRGLYNSATGTVEGMEKREEKKSPKGYVVTAVYVRFDSNPSKVFIVRRCSAYYFIKGPEKGSTGKGERRMRTQFPLVISYATTIHRVQGMTCSNVFVSTNYMFAAAHMFVALSRAKSLKGLHLLDYYPSKVMVDLEALQEYNRLRRSINLPVLPMPPGKKRNTHETLEKWSTFGQRASQLSVTGLNLMSQGSSGGPVARLKKSKKGIIEEEQPNPLGKEVKIELASQASSIRRTRLVPLRPLLPYENRRGQGEKSSCFVISAVNIMNQMVDMVEALLKMPRNELSPLLKGLIMLFTQQAAGIEGFRQLLPAVYHAGYGSPPLIIDLVMREYPRDILNMASFHEHRITMCCNCRFERKKDTTQFIVNLDLRKMKPSNNRGQLDLEKALEEQYSIPLRDLSHVCAQCGESEELIRRQFSFLPESKYLLIAPMRDRNSPKLTGYKKDGNTFFNQRFQLVGFAEFLPEIEHIRTWIISNEGGYSVVDDDELLKKAQLAANVWDETVVLLFRKKDVLRQTQTQKENARENVHVPIVAEPERSPTPIYLGDSSDEDMDIQELPPRPATPAKRKSTEISALPKPKQDKPALTSSSSEEGSPTLVRNVDEETRTDVKKVRFSYGNMFDVHSDALMNAANKELLTGGSKTVDGLIRAQAGPELTAELDDIRHRMLRSTNNCLPAGTAAITGAYRLHGFKSIVHIAVAILKRDRVATREQCLEFIRSHINAFELAGRRGLVSITCPIVGTGVYNWSNKLASGLGVLSAMVFYMNNPKTTLSDITFICFKKDSYHDSVKNVFQNCRYWHSSRPSEWKDLIRVLVTGDKNLPKHIRGMFESVLPAMLPSPVPPAAAPPVGPRPPQPAVSSIIPESGLMNRGTDCFLVSACQLLARCEELVNVVAQQCRLPGAGLAVKEMKKVLFKEAPHTVAGLRSLMPKRFDHGHADANDAVQFLLSPEYGFIPAEFEQYLRHRICFNPNRNCEHCGRECRDLRVPDKYFGITTVQMTRVYSTLSQAITNSQVDTMDIAQCPQCRRSIGGDLRVYPASDDTRYLFVDYECHQANRRAFYIRELVESGAAREVLLGASTYRLIAAIEYQAATKDNSLGHHMCWLRESPQGTSWTLANDSRLSSYNYFPDDRLKSTVVHLFERI